ncbi:MAG: hypothetical protein HFH35_07510 [Eubacterium sp.]|nr:hypothetical protein [Eubacterium sp.]
MFLLALILLLILMVLSTTKIMQRQKTGDASWGEPAVTVMQLILMGAMVIVMLL